MGRGKATRPLGAMRLLAVAAAFLAWAPAAAASPLAVRASFDARAVAFGETVRARVVVTVDPDVVRPGSVHVLDDVAPLTTLARATGSETRAGAVVVTVERTAACLDRPCVAANGPASPRLRPVRVTATARDGRTLRAAASWPALEIRGRVSAADLKRARPPFRADTAPPPPTYRESPSTLARLLDAAAIALGLCAAALAASAVRSRIRRRLAGAPVDELARALRLAREAQARPAPDRRRALGLLARLLDDRQLRGRTSTLAWARPEPEPHDVGSLVDDVERRTTG